ncbi:MAG: papain-like cysteine protease family protein [Phycisphaerales bacterium]|nr:papain-like cysteine protease family protein [Phycisphaerales bacterium]
MSRYRFSCVIILIGCSCFALLAGCSSTPTVDTQKLAPHIRLYNDKKTPKSEKTLEIWNGSESVTPVTVTREGPNEFLVTCPDFMRVSISQKTDVWCWAASAAMVQEYNSGQKADQAMIAARIHGRIGSAATEEERRSQARAAGYEEIIRALAPDVPEPLLRDATLAVLNNMSGGSTKLDLGDYAESQTMRNITNSDIMIDDLLRREPVVIGMRNFETDEEFVQARLKAIANGHNPDSITWGHVRVVYSARVAVAYKSRFDKIKEKANEGRRKIGGAFGQNNDSNPTEKIEDTLQAVGKWESRVPRKYDLIEVTAMNPLPTKEHDPDKAWVETIPGYELASKIVFMISAREAHAILEQEGYIDTK